MKFSHSFSLLLAALPFALAAPYNASRFTPRADSEKSVIIQMFQWSYDSVATECREFIGPAGYGYVQVSPAMEHVNRPEWWSDYQVVSYRIGSKHGSRDQFERMVRTCHESGVKVIVDTILNHMAGFESGTGTLGSSFTHYDYPGIYQYQDFHHCSNPGSDIINHDVRADSQNCELANLADLDTGAEYVRAKLAAHVQDLLSLGVDGLRIDAAKHIAAEELKNILGRVSLAGKYITQEAVIWSNDIEIKASEYTPIGDVQEFRFVTYVRDAFSPGGNLAKLENLDGKGWTPSDKANIFVANHDSERAGYSLTSASADNTYVLASIFSLAHSYGKPTVLSSYEGFNDNAGPNGGNGVCSEAGGANGWYCQHRLTAIAGMVRFHNTVGSEPVTNWVNDGSNRIAFARGNKGFIAINNSGETWTRSFPISMPDGQYCDITTAHCMTRVAVSGGRGSVSVPARSAIAIHIDAKAYCGAHHLSC